jgi:hypothetical protein
MTASRLRLTESALQDRLYSVSVSIVDYLYPWKMFVDYLAMICVCLATCYPSTDIPLLLSVTLWDVFRQPLPSNGHIRHIINFLTNLCTKYALWVHTQFVR